MNDRIFRNTMGKFATGVTIVTTTIGDNINGMTANVFMYDSYEAKLITISVDNEDNILDKIHNSDKFAVSIIGQEQQDLSMHFAGQKEKNDCVEFDFINSMPVVRNSLATVVCDVYDSHVIGDHTLFIGSVMNVVLMDGKRLIFY